MPVVGLARAAAVEYHGVDNAQRLHVLHKLRARVGRRAYLERPVAVLAAAEPGARGAACYGRDVGQRLPLPAHEGHDGGHKVVVIVHALRPARLARVPAEAAEWLGVLPAQHDAVRLVVPALPRARIPPVRIGHDAAPRMPPAPRLPHRPHIRVRRRHIIVQLRVEELACVEHCALLLKCLIVKRRSKLKDGMLERACQGVP